MMWEDIFQVYRLVDDKFEGIMVEDIMASDMTIDNAVLFVKAWFQENFSDQVTKVGIRRQPMDYGKVGGGDTNETY